MSTRATIHFHYEGEEKPAAIIYRHGDGYPEECGVNLNEFFARIKKNLQDTRFGDASYLAAKYVVFLAEQFNVDWETEKRKADTLDFISVGVCLEDPSDIAYRYVVECRSTGLPVVKCYSVHDNKLVKIPEKRPKN